MIRGDRFATFGRSVEYIDRRSQRCKIKISFNLFFVYLNQSLIKFEKAETQLNRIVFQLCDFSFNRTSS